MRKNKFLLIAFVFVFIFIVLYGYKGLVNQKDFKDMDLTIKSIAEKKIIANKIYKEDQYANKENLLNTSLETITIDINNTELELSYTDNLFPDNNSITTVILKNDEPISSFLLQGKNKIILPNEPGIYIVNLVITKLETGEIIEFGFKVIIK